MKPQDQHRSDHLDQAIADWTPTTESDAEMAARWAAEALKAGRYELGRALANIAANAHRAETHARMREVPMVGQTRDERPAERTPTYEEVAAAPPVPVDAHDVPQMDDDAQMPVLSESTAVIPLRAEDAQTELFGQPVSPAPVGPPVGARCQYEIAHVRGNETLHEACSVPVWWDHGDHQTPPGWRHVNPAVDQHHHAYVGPGPIIGG